MNFQTWSRLPLSLLAVSALLLAGACFASPPRQSRALMTPATAVRVFEFVVDFRKATLVEIHTALPSLVNNLQFYVKTPAPLDVYIGEIKPKTKELVMPLLMIKPMQKRIQY